MAIRYALDLRGEFDRFPLGFLEEDFECFEAFAVDGSADAALESVYDFFLGEVLAVGPARGERFEHVGDGEDADFAAEARGVQALVVAFAIEALVVRGSHVGDVLKAVDAAKDLPR